MPERMKNWYTFIILLLTTLVLSSTFGSTSSSSDTRSKAAIDPVDANTVEAAPTATKHVTETINCTNPVTDSVEQCPKKAACRELPAACLQCDFNCTCVYGQTLNVTCRARPNVSCQQDENSSGEIVREMVCRYCYQTPSWQHQCTNAVNCMSASTPRELYKANCTVSHDVVCLGRRNFLKKRECNWTSGYHWATALTLSLTLGGFGADRFYLGHWQEGIGKLFSFGGLGVWTIMDVILIAIRYLGPADGSLYI